MIIHSEQEMLDFGANFAKSIISDDSNIIELVGDVGAGKTTFVRGFAKGLGISQQITSPSFTISKSYALPNGKGNLIHYDFYRLQDPGLMSEDLAENLANPDNIIVIEWGTSISDLLPPNHTVIFIEKSDMDSREIIVKNNRSNTFRDISRPTGSELARSPVTTGATKRVEKSITRLFLNTSTPTTSLRINDEEYVYNFGHDLAEKLLAWLHDKLQENGKDFTDITEITFMSGPGSFTGLRIGATIVNALAHELNIPLYDHHGNQQPIIIPEYGRPANISKPIK